MGNGRPWWGRRARVPVAVAGRRTGRVRRRLFLVLVWLAGTTVALGLSGLALRAVGQRLEGSADGPRRAVASATTTTPGADPTTTSTSAPPTATTAGGTTTATSATVATSVPVPAAVPDPVATTPTATSGARTYVTAGGTVVVGCNGAAASLVAASPSVGWSVDVRSTGPERVEVRFERAGAADEETGGETGEGGDEEGPDEGSRVRATCRGGVAEAEVR